MINIICAMNNEFSIGLEGKLLYKIKKDLENFKKLTINSTVIMGHTTFKEISKPLINRRNIVLSRNKNLNYDNVEIHNTLIEAILSIDYKHEEVFIIGGVELYREGLFYADKVYLTIIEDNTEGDRYFPYSTLISLYKLNKESEPFEENGIKFKFKEYIKK